MGIRSDRFKTAGSGMVDRRYGCYGGETCLVQISERILGEFPEDKKRHPLKYMAIDKFFLRVYIQQAGMLPTKLLDRVSFGVM